MDLLAEVHAGGGADPAHRIAVRVVTSHPYHALFAKTLFIDPEESELADFEPDAVVFHAPEVEADPEEDGTRSVTFIVLHPSRAEVLIGDPGRSYFPKSGVEKVETYRVETTRELEDREIRETSVYRLLLAG